MRGIDYLIPEFFFNQVPPATKTDLGILLMEHAMSILKRDYPKAGVDILMGYLNVWNTRGGRPFSVRELWAFAETPPASHAKQREDPLPEVSEVPLFEEKP